MSSEQNNNGSVKGEKSTHYFGVTEENHRQLFWIPPAVVKAAIKHSRNTHFLLKLWAIYYKNDQISSSFKKGGTCTKGFDRFFFLTSGSDVAFLGF